MHIDLQRFKTIAEFLAPLIMNSIGVKPEVVTLVTHAINVAEAVGSTSGTALTGPEKKALAMDIVTTGLNAVNLARPGTVDVDQMTGAVSDGIDATVEAINAAKNIPVHPADVESLSVDVSAAPASTTPTAAPKTAAAKSRKK